MGNTTAPIAQPLDRAPMRGRRIAIDVSWVGTEPTGTGVYTQELVNALLRHDQHNTYVLYFKNPRTHGNPLWALDAPNVEKRIAGPGITNIRNQALAYHLYRDRIDLFHSTGCFLPFGWLGPKVLTIHDVNHMRFVRNWWRPGTRIDWLSLFVQVPIAAHASTRILTPSTFSAADIVRYLRVPANKIRTVPSIIPARLTEALPADQIARTKRRLGLSEYILFVGVLSPQKNLEGLIRAFAVAARRGSPSLKLVLAGKDVGGYGMRVLQPLARALDLEGRVVFTGYVSNSEVHALYAGSRCTALVSEGEGFGLTILEAMTVRTPVVAANTTGMVEVAGDAALLVDPSNVDAIAEALVRVCEDDRLRETLVERGHRRAQTFTPDYVAEQVWEVYREVVQVRQTR